MGKKTPREKKRGAGAEKSRNGAKDGASLLGRGARRFRWLFLAVVAFAIAVALTHLLFGIIVNDEGVTTMGAWRIVQGELPYRDFFSIITPFSFYYLAFFFKAGGISILTERVAGALLGVLLVVLTARLSTRYIPSPFFAALPVAILCASGVSLWPFPSHHWLASVLVLGSLLCAERGLDSGVSVWSAAAGGLGALAFWSLQDQGAYLWLGVAVVLVPFLKKDRRKQTIAGWFAGGAAVTLLFLPLVFKAGFSAIWYDLVVYGMTAYCEANTGGWYTTIKEMVSVWTSGGWSQAPFYMGNVLVTSVVTILIPHLSLPVIALGLWKKWGDRARLALLGAGCLSFVATAFHRWAGLNFQWAQAVPAVTVAWGLWVWHTKAARGRRWIPAAITAVLLASFTFYGAQRMLAVFDAARVHKVSASAGSLYTNNPFEARFVQETLDQIENRVEPKEPFLTTGLPFLNFWTLRPSPVPYDWFMPPEATTPSQTKEVMKILDEQKVQWIVTTRQFESSAQPFSEYLKSHYTRTWENPACGLWHRNEAEPQ